MYVVLLCCCLIDSSLCILFHCCRPISDPDCLCFVRLSRNVRRECSQIDLSNLPQKILSRDLKLEQDCLLHLFRNRVKGSKIAFSIFSVIISKKFFNQIKSN